MDWLGLGHVGMALVALVTGAVVVLRRKGTRVHRWTGRLYLAAMLAVNASALAIYDLFGHFGPFHAAALASLLTVVMGALAAWRRRPGWRIAHAYWMCWSYVGLWAAAVSESATRYLDFDFGWSVAGATGLVVVAGAVCIHRRLPPLLGLRAGAG